MTLPWAGPAVAALREGLSLAIAPEGVRSATPRLGRFKKGACHLAVQAGVPIAPVVVRNVRDAMIVRAATSEAVVLPPVDTTRWTRETLESEIDAIRRASLEILDQR